MPDATTMLRFHRLSSDHQLGKALLARVGKELQARGIKVNTGTIVDVAIIGAPSSTKNADKVRCVFQTNVIGDFGIVTEDSGPW